MQGKKYFATALCLFALLCSASLALARDEELKTRVAFVPLIYEGDDARIEVITARVNNELELKLKLMTAFNVRRVDDFNPYRGVNRLRQYTERYSTDNVLFGRVSQGRSGSVTVQMSLYDRGRSSVIKTVRKESPSIFEVFNDADELLGLLVREFSGMHIGFGFIEFQNEGEQGVYAVYIDGERAGTNLSKLGKVFNGKRGVEIQQNRMFGRETIYSGSVTVYEGKTADVVFQIPYLLTKEENILKRCEQEITEYRESREDRGAVLKNYNKLTALLGNTAYCWRLEDLREEYRQQEAEYRLKVNYWDIESSFFRPQPRVTEDIVSISADVATLRDPEAIRQSLWRNATYLFTVLRINAGYAFSGGRWEEGVGYYDEMERIVNAVPLDDRDWFLKEKEYVDARWAAYQKRINRNETMSEISMGVKMATRLNDLISDSQKVFALYDEVDAKELIILTDPWGMQLFVDDRKEGQSPVRLRRMEEEAVRIRIEDPWFSDSETVTALSGERNLLFMHARSEQQIEVLPVEVTGRNRYQLQWNELEDAKEYRIQVDMLKGDFSEPLFEKTGIRSNKFIYSEKLEPGQSYQFRVQAVNRNGIASRWSSSEPFTAEREG